MSTKKLTIHLVASVLTFMMLASTSSATVYYVATDGDDSTGNGTQVNPWQTIQYGIDQSTTGDTVLVLEGIYREAIDFNGKEITVSSLDPDDWVVTAKTIIDPNFSASNTGHTVTFDSSETVNSILKGFTITGGYVGITSNGGGVYCSGASPTIDHCLIQDNYAYFHGGGMYLVNSDANILRCIFYDNSALLGGAAYISGSGSVEMDSCLIYKNTATNGNGGGVYISGGADVDLTDCTVSENQAANGVAIYSHSSTTSIYNSILWNNGNPATQDEITYTGTAPAISDSTIRDAYSCGDPPAWCSVLGTDLGGNLDSDPLFLMDQLSEAYENLANPALGPDGYYGTPDDGFWLTLGSSAIDGGDNTLVPTGATEDIAGLGRIADGDDDSTATVDQGAYEGVYPAMHPFIIVRKHEMDALVAKKTVSPWKEMYEDADDLITNATFPLINPAGMKYNIQMQCYQTRDIISAWGLLYLLEPGNAQQHATDFYNKMVVTPISYEAGATPAPRTVNATGILDALIKHHRAAWYDGTEQNPVTTWSKKDWVWNVAPGNVVFNGFIVLDLMHDHLSESQRSAIYDKLVTLKRCIVTTDSSDPSSGRHRWHPVGYAIDGIYRLYNGELTGANLFQDKRKEYMCDIFRDRPECTSCCVTGIPEIRYTQWLTESGVFAPGSGYTITRLTGNDREEKHLFMDVLESLGFHDFYDNPTVQAAHEYLFGYTFTPMGTIIPFGDTSIVQTMDLGVGEDRTAQKGSRTLLGVNTAIYRASRFSSKAGAYASRITGNTTPTGKLLTYILMDEALPAAESPPSRIFPDGGAFFFENGQEVDSLSGALWNVTHFGEGPTRQNDSHTHKETNAIALTAYGEHVLVNAGYARWDKPSNDPPWTDNGLWHEDHADFAFVNQSAWSGNTVILGDILDVTDLSNVNHQSKASGETGGIIEGFTSMHLDYACGYSGDSTLDGAMTNGTHHRSFLMIHPSGSGSASTQGYWLLLDEVASTNASYDKAFMNLHPHTDPNGFNDLTITENQEYNYIVDVPPNIKFSENDVALTIFYGTPPSDVTKNKGILLATSVENSFIGDYLTSTYDLDSVSLKKNFVTVLFPTDQNHPKATMSRINQTGYTGVQVDHDNGVIDYMLESSGDSVYSHAEFSFRGLGLWCRKIGSSYQSYFVRRGRQFDDGDSNRFGFDSGSTDISIYVNGQAGHIVAPDSSVLVKFYSPYVSGVKLDGAALSVVNSSTGPDWVEVSIPQKTVENQSYLIELEHLIPYAHWDLDETSGTTADDLVGSNDGTLTNFPSGDAHWTTGQVNGALAFSDGSDDNDVVDAGVIDVSGSAISLAGWFYADSFTGTSGDGRIISRATGSPEDSHYWMLSTIEDGSDHRLRFRVRTNDGSGSTYTTKTLIAGSGNLQTGTWTHAVGVYDGSTMKLYKDGVEVGSDTKIGTLATSSTVKVSIGNQSHGDPVRPWDGLLDEVMIFDRALSSEEVTFLYETTK